MNRLLCALLALLLSATALAADTAPDLHDSVSTYDAYKASQLADYHTVDARYQAAIAAAPDDVALAVAHCRFFEYFQYAEDIDWSDSVGEDLDRCRDSLVKRAGAAPEVRVYQLEYADEDAQALGETTWKAAKTWPAPLRARIAARLSALYEKTDKDRAGDYAVIATRLGHADLVSNAIEFLDRSGEKQEASALAAASQPATSNWEAAARIKALGKLGDATAVRRELDRSLHAGLELSAKTRVDAYLAAHDLKAANAAAAQLGEEYGADTTRFSLALANGELAKARGLVKFSDDFNVWVERYSRIVGHAPLQALTLSLLPFTLVLVLVLCVLLTALLPAAFLVPVHYRGLIRRVQNRMPPPLFQRIGLRHAWIAAGIILIIPTLVLFVMRPDAIGALFTGGDASAATQFSVVAIGSGLSLLAMLPWLGRLRMPPMAGSSIFRLRVALVVLGCWLAIVAVGVLSHLVHSALIGGDSATLQTRAVHALVSSSRHEYGFVLTWLLIAALTPIVEEVVFRGMLLGGMARHISFGWANAIQALLFATVHGDAPRFLVYLMIGLLGGWLTRRYRSLLPTIALHALNNTFAVVMLS